MPAKARPGSRRALRASAFVAAAIAAGACRGSDPAPALSVVEIAPRWSGARPGGTMQLRAWGKRVGSSTWEDVTSLVSWRSSDTTVAKVDDRGAKGLATGVSRGWTSIYAGAGGTFGRIDFTVGNLHPVDRTLLAVTNGDLRYPSVEINDAGSALVAFGTQSSITSLQALISDGAVPVGWRAWIVDDVNYRTTTGLNQVVAMNEAGAVGIAYQIAADAWNISSDRFAVAYFDGVDWRYVDVVDGMWPPWLALMPDGTLYVLARDDWGTTTFTFTRFDAVGRRDATTLSTGGSLHPSRSGRLMMVNGAGSCTFDGTAWSDEVFFPDGSIAANPVVKVHDSGAADVIGVGGPITHFHFDGQAWSAGANLGGISSSEVAAAADDSGRLLVAQISYGSGAVVQAWVYDGVAWGPPTIISDDSWAKERLHAFADRAGRFVVLWNEAQGVSGTFHDGTWHPVETVAGGGSTAMVAAMNRDGRIVVVNDSEVWQVYSASLAALDP